MRHQLASVIKKELRQTFRDKRMIGVLVMAPVFQLTLLGFAVDLDVDNVPAQVIDRDHTRESRAFIEAMFADPTLVLSDDEPSVVIEVPRGYAADRIHGRSTAIQVLVDGTSPIRAQAAIAHVTQLIQSQALADVGPSIGAVLVEPRVLYNPSLSSPVYMVPGVAGVVLLIVTTVVTAMSIARERELGTIEQLLVTPMHPTVLLVGKIIPFAGIGLVAAGLVIAIGTWLFSVPVRGSMLALFLGTVLYLMSTLGTGVFISTMAKTQQQAILGSFFFIMPAILLSGFMSPIENMPQWIRWLSAANPVRYYVQILRAVLLKGADVVDLATPLLALAAFGLAILGMSAARFQKRIA